MAGHRLICGDVLDVLPTLGRFKCLIADPPDNIGLSYGEYDDRMDEFTYKVKFWDWMTAFCRHADIVWISFNAKWWAWAGECVNIMANHHNYENYEARLFIQSFTFGQNRQSDCGNGYRPLLRLKHRHAILYPDAIKIPSWRQQNGDKRAAAGGRVPLDHWGDFPRITGNCKERRAWHPTQLREAMIERIIKFSTQPGDAICDCFSGTGTVLRAVNNLSWVDQGEPGEVYRARNPVTSIELDAGYCEKIATEHGLDVETWKGEAA